MYIYNDIIIDIKIMLFIVQNIIGYEGFTFVYLSSIYVYVYV